MIIRLAFYRVLQGVLSLIGIVAVVFVLARLTGSPARQYLPQGAPQSMVTEFNIQHGFNKPIGVQFLEFAKGVAHLQFGTSLSYGGPAINIVLNRYPATLELATVAMLVSITLGVVLGVLAARKPRSIFGEIARTLSLLGVSAPAFWIGIVGITVFAVFLRVLPTSGAGSDPRFWILPVATLAFQPIGILVQVVRNSMMEALQSDYVKVARAKGVPESSILFRHALRNASIPALTVAGTLAASLINGALVVETVFGWPGVGQLMVQAIETRDFAVIQAVIFVTAAAIIVLNFLVDLGYMWLNPQIRYQIG
jgi:peptide/nickel transport system permease protein